MQTLKQIYRSTYSGENIITQLTLSDNEWSPEVEFAPNQVFNSHTSTQAVAIGNGPSLIDSKFDLVHITNHKGGLFAENKLQSYGCNNLYKTFTPDFLIAIDDVVVEELANSEYYKKNIVYTTGRNVLNNVGKFYLIPQNLTYDAGAIAAYMACFDGHKKIFLLGYDGYSSMPEHPNQAFWISTLSLVAKTYNNVEFVRVMPSVTYACAPELLRLPNFRQIDYRGFVLEADIG